MKLLTPFAYALALLPAVAVTVALGSVLAGLVGRGALWYALLVVSGFAVGAALYTGLGRLLILYEGRAGDRLGGHARRCALLYVALALTLVWGVFSFVSTGGVGWPTFATEMQVHVLSVVLAALAVDRMLAPANGGKP
ncbi:hypothetical protein [Rubrobacter radiotolerans]|uniref:Uncharacterized protein n=1 Tax=Rubrobacter radiotolerans TaxID=42256 RepID=A0AB35T4Q8_RUBRA|nr:hypothetical protein [Rubrobacter radiotolerans]MDX5893597.1 hypothetical protein [Rubrobacter radiotolerans]